MSHLNAPTLFKRLVVNAQHAYSSCPSRLNNYCPEFVTRNLLEPLLHGVLCFYQSQPLLLHAFDSALPWQSNTVHEVA